MALALVRVVNLFAFLASRAGGWAPPRRRTREKVIVRVIAVAATAFAALAVTSGGRPEAILVAIIGAAAFTYWATRQSYGVGRWAAPRP